MILFFCLLLFACQCDGAILCRIEFWKCFRTWCLDCLLLKLCIHHKSLTHRIFWNRWEKKTLINSHPSFWLFFIYWNGFLTNELLMFPNNWYTKPLFTASNNYQHSVREFLFSWLCKLWKLPKLLKYPLWRLTANKLKIIELSSLNECFS